jgi:hypothetical protein
MTTTTRWMLLLTLLSSCGPSSVAGTGSDAGPGGSGAGNTDCSTFTACGGDLTGTWNIASICQTITTDPIKAVCPTGSTTYTYSPQGSYTFNGDGTASSTLALNATATVQLPAACLTGATTCDSLAGPMKQGGGTSVQSVTCSGNVSTACTCIMTMAAQNSESGTYKINGNSVVMTSSTGMTQTNSFCVEGNVLKMQGTSGGYVETLAATKG